MNSMPNSKQTDAPDAAVAAIMQAYEELGRGDEQFAFVDERVFKSEQDVERQPSDQQTRPAVPDRRSSRRRLLSLGPIGLLLALCFCVAALAWQSPYGDAANLAQLTPQRVSTSSLPLEKQEVSAQLTPPSADGATAKAALPQPTLLAQAKPQDVAPTAAPLSSELAPWLRTTPLDPSGVEQAIEQFKISQEQIFPDNATVAKLNAAINELKAGQEQMARDNAAAVEQLKAAQAQMARDVVAVAEQLKTAQAQMARDNAAAVEQLKTAQEQLGRLIAKTSEQNLPPRTQAARPTTAPMRPPVSTLPSSQARVQPQAPVRSQPKQP
jgi:hypothetical protein